MYSGAPKGPLVPTDYVLDSNDVICPNSTNVLVIIKHVIRAIRLEEKEEVMKNH